MAFDFIRRLAGRAKPPADDGDPVLDWVPVESSNLKEVAWAVGRLYVRFLNGSTYRYNAVPEAVYKGLLGARSKGQYLHRNVKLAGYKYARVV